MMLISCLLTCCTLILSPNSVWTNAQQQTLYLERNKCKLLERQLRCLQRLQFKTVTKDALLYAAICGKDNN